MNSLIQLLRGNFVICDLGSSGKEFHEILKPFSEAITLIELDAAEESGEIGIPYFKRIILKTGISGTKGKRKFYQRKFLPCSSFLQPDENVVREYGLENYFELERTIDLDCTTLESLVSENGVQRIDFLKTDLEGLDFEILNSAPSIVSSCLAVQSELRPHSLYLEEPTFSKSLVLLENMGFDLVSIKPEIWKYNTKDREIFRDGRLAWGDFIFFLSPSKVRKVFGRESGCAFCKQILIAKMLNLNNYAAYLFEQNVEVIPTEYHETLRAFVYQTGRSRNIVLKIVKLIGSTSLGNSFLRRMRILLAKIQTLLDYDKNIKHVGSF